MSADSVPYSTGRIDRRHDLDALRAIAMLLGIVLHAILGFLPIPGAWPVQDSMPSSSMGLLLAVIHGFRMPLFFVISGFFTMMLIRRRGLRAVLWQRFKRIFLPFLVGMITIIPLNWVCYGVLAQWQQQRAAAQSSQIERREKNPSSKPSTTNLTSGWYVAASGNVEAVDQWLDSGGDINHREKDGATALHGAFLFGKPETAESLIQAGADPQSKNNRGESCVQMLYAPWGITKTISNLVSIELDHDQVLAGRRQIARMVNIPPETIQLDKPSKSGIQRIEFLFAFPATGHLWFLWFLCWLVSGLAIVYALGRAAGLPRLPAWFSSTSFRYVWLIPLTAIPAFTMHDAVSNFGPATSLGILPLPSVLLYYAVFFGFGALFFDAHYTDSSPEQHAQRSSPSGVLGLIMMAAGCLVLYPSWLYLSKQVSGPRTVIVLIESTYTWLMIFASIRIFACWFSRPSALLRYLSDASYWMYLIHIPLIFFVQYWIAPFAINPWIKLPIVCVLTGLILMISYHVLVRSTPIGWFLNGRRYEFRFSFSASPISSAPQEEISPNEPSSSIADRVDAGTDFDRDTSASS